VNLYAYAGNNPVTFSDPFGLKACPGIANTDQDNLDDCPAGSPGYYAAAIAKGRGSSVVNNVLGVVATMGQTLAEHVGGDWTVGFRDYSTDAYGLVGIATHKKQQVDITTDRAIDLPKLGAGVHVTLGRLDSSPGDYTGTAGLKHWVSATATFDASGGLKSISFNIGITTPALPGSGSVTP
jgi:hypothetical protein